MSANPAGIGRRIALRAARVVLWPAALIRPESAWARMYRRIRDLERDDSPANDAKRASAPSKNRKVSPPLVTLVVLIGAAFAIWLHDLLRRPAPPPPALLPGIAAPAPSFAPIR